MPNQKFKYYTNGKLLLSGEYFVLQGAEALALPVKLGQSLTINNSETDVRWQSKYKDHLWFSAVFQFPGFTIQQTTDDKRAQLIAKIFKTIQELNPEFELNNATDIRTNLDFEPEWGLGSSSTLIANLAKWTQVDPYVLNERIFHGSGFDIACADATGPIFYTKGNKPENVKLDYPFTNQLYLIYQGQKQNTQTAIHRFKKDIKIPKSAIQRITELTRNIAYTKSLQEFNRLVIQHEQEVSNLTGLIPIQQAHFSDFQGVIKSLGAWGGDFILVASELPFETIKTYFSKKKMNVVFRWDDLILNRRSNEP